MHRHYTPQGLALYRVAVGAAVVLGAVTYRELRERQRDETRAYLADLLDHANGKAELAAMLAGCNRTYFYWLLKQHGLRSRAAENLRNRQCA